MVQLLTHGIEGLLGIKFYVEGDPEKASENILSQINGKRKKLGLSV